MAQSLDDLLRLLQGGDETALPPGDGVMAIDRAPAVVASEPAPEAAPELPTSKYTPEARASIQAENENDASGPNWLAGIAALGAGLQGKNAGEAGQNFLKMQQGQRDAKLTAFDEAKKQELSSRDNDPNSPESKQAQAIALNMGLKPEQVTGLTAAKFKEFSPALSKTLDVRERSKDRALANDYRKDSLDQRNEARDEKLIDQLTGKLKDDINPNRPRGGNLGKSQAMINSAERVEGLLKQFPDGNIPAAQTTELASSVAALISGGSPQSQHQIDAITPSSLHGDASKIASWITGDPKGSGQQAFIKMLADTANREKQVATDQVRRAQIAVLPAYAKLKKANPELYSSILSSNGIDPEQIDEKGQYKAPVAAGAPAFTPDVLDYAKTHNISPQEAAVVKKQRGG